MRHLLILGILLHLGSALTAWAHSPALTIFVRENNSLGAPMPGVEITVAGMLAKELEARPASTDSTGSTKLVFPNHQAGEILELKISHEGYELVNDLQRTIILSKDPHAKLDIFLCQAVQCPKKRFKFYWTSTEPLKRDIFGRFGTKLRELESQGNFTAENLRRIEGERDHAEAAVVSLAIELSRLRPGEGSVTYRRALQLFSEGKSAEALCELDAVKLARELKLVRARKHATVTEFELIAKSFTLRGKILMSQCRFDEAEKAFEEAIATSPESLDATSRLAQLRIFLNATDEGGLERTSKPEQDLERHFVGNSKVVPPFLIAILDSEIVERHGEAAKNPEVYLPYVATKLNNLEGLHNDQKRMDNTQAFYEESLRTYRELAAKNPEDFLPHVAAIVNSLGILYRDQNRVDDAITAYEESLRISRELAARSPEVYLSYVVVTLLNLGILHRDQNHPDRARASFEEALRISRELPVKYIEGYLPYFGETANHLGILYVGQNQLDSALIAFEEALQSFSELAAKNPEAYLRHVAMALVNIGIVHDNQNRPDNARIAFERALRISRELAAKSPEIYLPYFAAALSNLGNLKGSQNQLSERFAAHEEALQSYRKLAAEHPEAYLPDLAMELFLFGDLRRDQSRNNDARAAYEESLRIYRELATNNSERFLPPLVRLLDRFGLFEAQNSNFDAASLLLAEDLATRKRLAALRPPGDRSAMARLAGLLAYIYRLAGQATEAATTAQEALSLISTLESSEQSALEKLVEVLQGLDLAVWQIDHRPADLGSPRPARP